MNIDILKKVSNRIELPLIVIWELLLIIRMVSLYSLLPSKLDTAIFSIISVLGIMVLFRNTIEWINKKRKYDILMILFVLAALISSVHFGSDILVGNIKIIFWQVLLLFVIFENGKSGSYFSIVEKILTYAWFVLVSISLFLFFTKVSFTIPLAKLYYGIRFGFVENRLFGVFVDPNFAATISVVVTIISINYFRKAKDIGEKIFLIINIVMQIFYISLSGSRTAIVEIVFCVLVAFFLLIIRNSKKLGNFVKSVVVSLLSVAISILIINATQSLSLKIVNSYGTPNVIQEYISKSNSKQTNGEIIADKEKQIKLERKDVENNKDISNNRFNLWKSAFDIFKETPVFGTSPRGLIPFAQKNLPENLIGKNGQSPHNFVLYSLASVGLLGTIPLILFLLYNIFKTLLNMWHLDMCKNIEFLTRALVTLAILISGSLLPDLIFFNKLGSFLFWMYLGNVVSQNVGMTFTKGSRG